MDVKQIITDSSRAIADQYVLPEVGSTIAQRLTRQLAEGRYDGAATAQELANLVTVDLQSVNGDGHLRLIHHVDEVPDMPSEEMYLAMAVKQASSTMDGVRRVERLDGNIALLVIDPVLFDPPIAGNSITAALQLVAKADALIIDVRTVRGGDPYTVALICSYLFDGPPTHLLDMHDRQGKHLQQFWTLPYVPGPRFGGTKPIRVLTSAGTFSGGEELANDLQFLGRAMIVGERTGGGAHPRVGLRVHPHLELAVPVARPTNPGTNDNWEGVGIIPDIEVPAEGALDAALQSLQTQTATACKPRSTDRG
ncbi:S41 family peptidase [Actinopolymorpha sp. B17G11]|uniref:S41 family peptidase n=1 Tax=Actinopolymorpha sp. B17G11 TaxID=3160861 RepID=UPI0032E41C40